MTRPRKELVSVAETPYYHVVSRCTRRAFSCGLDAHSGISFEHRKHWIRSRLSRLCSVFAIDLCAYAVMSNHYHLVIRIDPDRARAWDDQMVLKRWATLFHLPLSVLRWYRGAETSVPACEVIRIRIDRWRNRLADLSWFVRSLNEHVARRANVEDGRRGRFWDGRFRSRALLDEKALLTAMAYVDLNPIRTGLTDRPEASEFTSLQQRYRGNPFPALCPFLDDPDSAVAPIRYALLDYLDLVDWTGRSILQHRPLGSAEALPPMLDYLRTPPDAWLHTILGYDAAFYRAVGPIMHMRSLCHRLGQRWLCGLNASRRLYPNGYVTTQHDTETRNQ